METKEKLMKVGAVLLVILCLFVLVKTFSEVRSYRFIGLNNNQVATIIVSGQGKVSVAPDIAELSLGVLAEAKDVKTAQNNASKKNNDVLAYLEKAGIDVKKDVKSTASLNPQYSQQVTSYCGDPTRICPPDSGRSVIVGYEARYSLQVKVRDLDKLGEIIAGVGGAGVTDINGPYLSVDKVDEFKLQTRAMAIEDAQNKADRLAKDLGVKLVRIIYFNEDGDPIYYGGAKTEAIVFGMGGDSVVPNIPVGENEIMSNVMITYEIH